MTSLQIGDTAPKFQSLDEAGNSISLADYKGKKLVLFFYPKASTPGCTVEACNLSYNYSRFTSLGYDVLGVSADSAITMHVPLHFINEELCLGAKAGGIITHQVVEVDIRCLPKDLPEYIAVDMQMVDLGETIHLSELVMPEGVQATALMHGDEDDQGHDPSLVSVQLAREEVEAVEGEEAQ